MVQTTKKKKSAKEREQDLLKLVLDLKTQNERLWKRTVQLEELNKAQSNALRLQSDSDSEIDLTTPPSPPKPVRRWSNFHFSN